MADPTDPYAFLAGISANPTRPGDTSNFNPQFATRLAAAIQQAKAQGLNVGVASGYRNPLELSKQGNANANFDAAGNSLHSYGLAADVNGIGQPGSSTAKTWASIAAQNGLYNPYNRNGSEWNHWQAVPFTLDQNPNAKAALSQAASTGNFQNVWAAANPYLTGAGPSSAVASAGAPTRPTAPAAPINPGLTVNTSPLGASHAQFITDYAKSIGLDPNLALGIANAEGLKAWSASNPNAASKVDVTNGVPWSFGDFQLNVRNGMGNQARAAGIDPADPNQWQAADKFALNQMKAGGVGPWKGDPVAAAYLKSGQVQPVQAPGPIDPSIIARGGVSPAIPGGVTPATPAVPGTTLAGLPGSGTSGGDNFVKSAQALDKAIHGDQSPGQEGGQGAAFMPAGARNVSPFLPMARQLYGNTLTSMATPLSWGQQTPGQSPYANAGGAPIGQQYGTSLASLQQMRQMMAMQGSPYASLGDAGYG